jgi:hypothetical protein
MALEETGQLLQHAVPGLVAVAVVHRLEAVEVGDEQGGRSAVPALERDGAGQLAHEAAPVGKAGQRILVGQRLEGDRPLLQLGHLLLEPRHGEPQPGILPLELLRGRGAAARPPPVGTS